MVDMLENSCITNPCECCKWYCIIPCPAQFKVADQVELLDRYHKLSDVQVSDPSNSNDTMLQHIKEYLLFVYNINTDQCQKESEDIKMKLFSDCRDACILCACFRIGCLAGHGDDDFVQASQEEMIARLYDTNISESDKRVLIKGLEKYYHIDSLIIEQYRELVGNPYDVSIDEFLDIVKRTKECIDIAKSVKPKEKPIPFTINTDGTSLDRADKDWLDSLCDSKDYAIKYKDLAYKPQTNEESYDFNAYIKKIVDDLYKNAMNEVTKTRPTKDQYYLDIAMTVATRGTCMRRKFGAIIVKNDKIVSTGYAGAPSGRENCCDRGVCYRIEHNIPQGVGYLDKCRSVHAEMNAIIQASKEEMEGATLYLCGIENDGSFTDAAPCSMCKRVIINAGIETVIARQSNSDIKITPVSSYIENDDSLDINHQGY